MVNYYEILGVSTDCGFNVLKKAYYRRAKECHPDHFGNDPAKKEEFQTLVEAFVTLSDPVKRRNYDSSCMAGSAFAVFPQDGVIMDTDADDTLEELIVGNDPPPDTTLFTFFLDLERTCVFMTSREARQYYEKKHYKTAAHLYEQLIVMAPTNILYRVYFARCLVKLGYFRQAATHYKAAITIGKHRDPPQHLRRVHQELRDMRRKQMPWIDKMIRFFKGPESRSDISPEDEMIASAERAMARMLNQSQKPVGRKILAGPKKKD